MTTVGAGRSTSIQRLARTALGIIAGAVIAVATVVVGTQVLGDTPPSLHCAQPYQCVQLSANPLVPQGSNPLAPDKPAMWNSGSPAGPVTIPYASPGA